MTNPPNKRGPKPGSTSFSELTLEEILELLALSPTKRVPVRRKWVEICAANKFLKKEVAPQEKPDKVESVIVQELDLDETIDENDTRNW